MARPTRTRKIVHECSKVCVLLGIVLLLVAGALFTAEAAAQDKLDVLEVRAMRYKQTEYAYRYAKHARVAEKRVVYLQGLRTDWGDPTVSILLLVLGGVVFAPTMPQPVKTRRKRSTAPRPPERLRSRPRPARPRR